MFKTTLEKLAWICCGICILAACLIPSCQSMKTATAPISPTQDIHNLGTDISATGTDLKQTTTNIQTHATAGMAATPASLQPVLNPHWTSILTSAGVQTQLVANLATMTTQAAAAEQTSKKFEQDYNTEHAARLAAENNTTKELKEKYMAYSGILFFISLICGGLAVWSNGNKIAMWGSIICAVGAAVAIFVVQALAIIPWVIGGLALAALGFGIYTYIHNQKLLAAQKAAATTATTQVVSLKQSAHELVETIEATKPKMTTLGRKKLFGEGPTKGESSIIQSRETESLVKGIRWQISKAPSLPCTVSSDFDGDGVLDVQDVLVQPKTINLKKYVLK
jgi:hypothetical protein